MIANFIKNTGSNGKSKTQKIIRDSKISKKRTVLKAKKSLRD